MSADLNSPNFSDAEAENAIQVDSVDCVIAELRERRCEQCEDRLFPTLHEQLRRSGGLYWRVRLACSRMHRASLVFKVGSHQVLLPT